MSVPTAGDVIQLTIEAEVDGTEDQMNVYEFRIPTHAWADEDDYLSDLQELVAAIVTIIRAFQASIVVWKRFRARNLTTGEAAVIAEMDTPLAGAGAIDPLPFGCAGLVVFRTAESGVLLRKFIGGLHESQIGSDGQIIAATVTSLSNYAASLMAGFSTTLATWEFGHISGQTSIWLTPTSAYASAEPAYQRRRRRGTGS